MKIWYKRYSEGIKTVKFQFSEFCFIFNATSKGTQSKSSCTCKKYFRNSCKVCYF